MTDQTIDTILLIDDDQSVRTSYERMIKEQFSDYRVMTVKSGEEGIRAMEMLEKKNIPVVAVLCDWNMEKEGGMDGIETISLFTERWPTTKRAFLSAYGRDTELVKKAYQIAKTDEFIDKDADPHIARMKLFSSLRRMIANYEKDAEEEEFLQFRIKQAKSDLEAQLLDKRSIGFGDLWSFYTTARFIYTDKQKGLANSMDEIENTWRNLLASGTDMHYTTLRDKDHKPRNSLSMINYFPNTWIVQHMVSKREPIGMMVVLLNSIQWLEDNPEIDYAKFYWRPNNPVPEFMFQTMADRLSGLDDAHVLEQFDYHNIPIQALEDRVGQTDPSINTGKASDDDLTEISGLLKGQMHPLVYSADSMDDLPFKELSKKYEENGLKRERVAFYAKKDDKIIGVAVAEYSSLGLNLSYYFNKFQTFLVDGTKKEKDQAVNGLLNEVAKFYSEKGRDFVITLNNPEKVPQIKELGFEAKKQYNALNIKKAPGGFMCAYEHLRLFYEGKMAEYTQKHSSVLHK